MLRNNNDNKNHNPKNQGPHNNSRVVGDTEPTTMSPVQQATTSPRPTVLKNLKKFELTPTSPIRKPLVQRNWLCASHKEYKLKTKQFMDALQKMVPINLHNLTSSSAPKIWAEYVVSNNMEVDDELLDDLDQAIQGREYVAIKYFGGGDGRHKHFIKVLKECQKLLEPCRKKPYVHMAHAHCVSAVAIPSYYANVSTDTRIDEVNYVYEIEEIDEIEEADSTEYTLHELIHGTDRTNALIFLLSLNELMHHVSDQYTTVKDAAEIYQELGCPQSSVVQHMLVASVATNLVLQEVASLEQSFIADNPHLNTVYRVFALLAFDDEVQRLTEFVTKKSPKASRFNERDAVEFLGDVIESAFRSKFDTCNKRDTLVKEFLERWQFMDGKSSETVISDDWKTALERMSTLSVKDDTSLQQLCSIVVAKVQLEAPMPGEQVNRRAAAIFGRTSHSWVPFEYIGGIERSISHTIRILQGLSYQIGKDEGIFDWRKRNFFLGQDDDYEEPFSRIPGEMDDILMDDILPSLVNMCSEGMMSNDLPYQSELLAAFAQIKFFVQCPEQPVSWALAFTVHSILTSVYEVQQSNQLRFLGQVAHDSFQQYFGQLKRVKQSLPPISFDTIITEIQPLQKLDRGTAVLTVERAMCSIWNPYCAGAYLTYVTYCGNIEGGLRVVDSMAQLRMTLHLSNALKQVEAIKPGQIEILDDIFKAFRKCKAIWKNKLPKQGQFQSEWWAKLPLFCDPFQHGVLNLVPKSYRRLCLHDFHGEFERHRKEPEYNFAVQVNGTLAAMEADHQLLAMNLVSLGHHLNDFWSDLFTQTTKELGTEAQAKWKDSDGSSSAYQHKCQWFAEKVMASLDAGDGTAADFYADRLETYFKAMRPSSVMWFKPVKIR